ncbi:MAG TPA: hypothetical protein VIS94_03045 [Desulfomonilia bacterium]
MNKLANLIPSIMIALILLIMTGCSGGGSESDVTTKTESYDTPGTAVAATTYADASSITLLKDSETGAGYQIVEDGATFEAGSKVKLGVRVEGGKYKVNQVLVSDGGGNQIKTTYDSASNLYICKYPVSDTDRLMPVLIQAIHPNGQASKAKYVFRTEEFAKSSQLIRNGLGVLVGKDILQSARGMSLSGLTVDNLIPFKGTFSTDIMKLTSGIISLPFNLVDGLSGNEGIDEEVAPTLKLKSGILNIPMGINSLLLDDLLGGMAGDLGADMSGLNLAAKPLYLDINGIPKSTTSNMSALSIGLFMAKGVQGTFPSGVTLYPGSNAAIPLTQTSDDPSAIEVSLSQENMTQFVSELLNGNVVIPALDIPTAVPSYKDVKPAVLQQMKISFNKNGIAFDFKTANPLLIINDLRIEYLENGKALWMMSLDLAFKLDAGSHQAPVIENANKDTESFLDIYLTLVPYYSHCAVLKDDMGIMMFDHSDFAALLVGGLGDMLPTNNPKKGDLMLSITTGALLKGTITDDGFGMILTEDGASAVSDGAGRCFLKMATDDVDISKAGLCFINTANLD